MNTIRRWSPKAFLILGLSVGVIGCIRQMESGPKVGGRILIDGQPCHPVSVLDFELLFTSAGEGPIKKSYAAAVEADGTFTFHGAIGKGVPVGKYKVVVSGLVKDASGKPTQRYLNTFNIKNTPLDVEITNDSKEILIDLEKKTATVS